MTRLSTTAVFCLLLALTWASSWPMATLGQSGASPAGSGITFKSAQVLLIGKAELSVAEAGLLTELNVKEGHAVKAGQLLGRVDDTRAISLRERARVELEIAREKSINQVDVEYAQAAHEVAEAKHARAKDSNSLVAKSVPSTEMDELRLEEKRTELAIKQAALQVAQYKMEAKLKEHELSAAEIDVQRRQITSPFDGRVVEVKKTIGEWANTGDSVIRVIRLDRLRVEVSIDALAYGRELEGCKVELEVELTKGRRERFVGEVVFVNPEIESVENTYRLWAEVDNLGLRLNPGMTGVLTVFPNTAPSGR